MAKLTGGLGGLAEDSRSDMDYYSRQITTLIEELSCCRGSAANQPSGLAFHIINMPKEQVASLTGAITQAKANIRYCRECFTLTDQELCPICSSEKRDHRTIMVVENTRDLAAYEKQENMTGYTMCFMERFLPCWALVPMILS